MATEFCNLLSIYQLVEWYLNYVIIGSHFKYAFFYLKALHFSPTLNTAVIYYFNLQKLTSTFK